MSDFAWVDDVSSAIECGERWVKSADARDVELVRTFHQPLEAWPSRKGRVRIRAHRAPTLAAALDEMGGVPCPEGYYDLRFTDPRHYGFMLGAMRGSGLFDGAEMAPVFPPHLTRAEAVEADDAY